MNKIDDVYHAFPSSVDRFSARFGEYSTKIGSDGKVYQWLEMKGSITLIKVFNRSFRLSIEDL
ncbi:MAG: hypothetical protein JSS09_08455 [Verrucomicrobia bacterium]|nr:hypothetical protein [Verrucomicrobiota bacterium]